MIIAGRILLAATLVTAMTTTTSTWSTDDLDDQWAAKVLSDPSYDEGWTQRCQDVWNDGRESHCEVREFEYRGDGPIAIDGGHNGGMTVMGWDRKDIRVLYRVKARAQSLERAKSIANEVRLEIAKGWIRPDGPTTESRRESWSVELKVWAPRKSDLSLRTHNGPLGVRSLQGTMEIHSLNGPVSLVDVSGAVMARVTNGPLHVALEGSKWTGAGLDAEAQNGPVNFALPKNYSARLETGTINGPSMILYPLTFAGRVRGHFTATLGSGGAPVRVVTDNGPFRLVER